MLLARAHAVHSASSHQLLTDGVICAYRTRFWWDLAAWIPWDYLALLVLGDFHAGSSIVARVPLLRLLRLVRNMVMLESCQAQCYWKNS